MLIKTCFVDVLVAVVVVVCQAPSLLGEFPKGPGKRGHIVADTLLLTQMFPRLPERATFVADTRNVSDFVHKHFVPAANVSQFAQPKKHHGQQRVRNNVSPFTRASRTQHIALNQSSNPDSLIRSPKS